MSVLKACFQKSLYWSNPLFLSLVSRSAPRRPKRTCPWAIWCHWAAPWPRCTPKATWPSCPTPQWWASHLLPPPRQTKTRMTTKITILSSLLFLLFFHSLYHTHTHSFNVLFDFLSWSYAAALSRGETLYLSTAGKTNLVVHCVFIFYIFHFLKAIYFIVDVNPKRNVF